MNNESPLIPQGSFLEQKNKGRARVKVAVFIVLAIHGAGLVALLMQGCQKEPDPGPVTDPMVETNEPAPPTFDAPVQTYVPETNIPIQLPTNTPIVTEQEPVYTPPVLPEPPPKTGTQHKIVRGDTLSDLAKLYNVSVKAIQTANPGLEPTRLRIGQEIQIPPPTEAPSTTVDVPGKTEQSPNGSTTYKVQSGDTLIRIANRHGTSVKELRSLNGLRTDRIKVGQVLKLPTKNNGGTSGPK